MKSVSAVLLGILLTDGGIAIAQQSTRDVLEEAARSALSGDPAAIRMLTDTVISQLPLTFHSTLNMSDTVFQAELQYRQQARAGASIGQLVSALNRLADDLKLPSYVKTNANQVQTYRMLMSKAYPLFASAPRADAPSDLSLSPAAATFLLLHLLQLKLIDPSYQTDPDTWVQDTEKKRKETASQPPSRSLVFRVSPSSIVPSPHYQALARGLADNSPKVVGAFQLMLRTLGI
jgi:hypothetical protein